MATSARRDGTQRVGGSGDATRVLAMTCAVLVALAVLKPWGGAPATPLAAFPSGRLLGAATPAVATPVPPSAPAETSPGPGEIECQGGWQLVSLSQLADWTTREWLPVEPSSAGNPLDPALVPVLLADGPVRALGICAADDPASALSPTTISRAWRLGPGARSAVAVPIQVIAGQLRPAGFARLYRPVAAGTGPGATWPGGRYVLEVDWAIASGPVWLAVTIGSK